MTSENEPYLTRLYHGLPAVMSRGRWLVLSPYAEAVAEIEPELIDVEQTRLSLNEIGFFGSPSLTGPGRMSDFFQLTLITTNDCNLQCGYCFAFGGEPDAVTMDKRVALAGVRYALEKAVGRKLLISFFGGEPTLTPELIRIVVDHSREKVSSGNIADVAFNITTNGVVPLSFLDFMISNEFFLTISTDGTPEVQNLQRPRRSGKQSSNHVERSIRRLVGAGCDFMVRATVTAESVGTLVNAVEYLGGLGVTKIQFEPLSLAGRAAQITQSQQMSRPSPSEFADNLIGSIVRGAELGVSIMNSSYMNAMQPSTHFCDGVGGNRVAVTYGGDVTTCLEVQGRCHPSGDRFIIGSYDPDTNAILVEPGKQQTLCGALTVEENPDCQGCFARYICAGGCPIRNYHTTGDPARTDPLRCEVTKRVLPFVIELMADGGEQDERG